MINLLSRNNLQFKALLLWLACLFGGSSQIALGQTTQSPLPRPTGYVNDYANVIDAATKQRLETVLENLKRVGQIEAAVVTVHTTGDQDIFDYSLAVARGWGIGPKDAEQAGLLLLVAVDDRKYFTQVSRHLEGDLPDGLLGQIQREKLVPRFREGNYSQGISDTINAYIATLAQSRGFSMEGIDQRQSYRGRYDGSRGGGGTPQLGFSRICLFGLILFIVVIFLSRSGRGGGGGCLNLFLLGSLLNSGSRGSGWGGGGFGGGGGGGFGGFGGGGDFGGGGAGGSW